MENQLAAKGQQNSIELKTQGTQLLNAEETIGDQFDDKFTHKVTSK